MCNFTCILVLQIYTNTNTLNISTEIYVFFICVQFYKYKGLNCYDNSQFVLQDIMNLQLREKYYKMFQDFTALFVMKLIILVSWNNILNDQTPDKI